MLNTKKQIIAQCVGATNNVTNTGINFIYLSSGKIKVMLKFI